MDGNKVKKILKYDFKFSDNSLANLSLFHDILLKWNKKYNLISKSTENDIWNRHILDSAQLLSFLRPTKFDKISDLGSGAGFPGLVLAFFYENMVFHVKLYEKSPVKRDFLNEIKDKVGIQNLFICKDVYSEEIDSDIIVCRAFKKLKEIIRISREKIKKPHKLLILKGKNAQEEINKVSLGENYSYKLENSITGDDSKIIIVNAK